MDIKKNSDKVYKIIVFLLFVIVFVTSFYKLGLIPNYINVDEAGTILNATTLNLYGTDRYGTAYPIYPQNYYGGQSLLPTLLVSLSNNSIFDVRLPYAIIRCICSFFVYFTLENKKEKIISLFLYAIWPFFIMSSRFVLDCDLMVYILIIAIYFLFHYFRNRKIYNLILAGIFFGLTFYTYALSYIYIPLILLALLIYTFINKKYKLSIKEIVVFIIPLIILGIPLLLRLLVDKGYIGEFSFLGITFNKLPNNRLNDISIKNIKFSNILNFIKCIFIEDGFDTLSYGFGGPCYYLSLILIVVYFIKTKKQHTIEKAALVIMLVATFLISMLLSNQVTWRFNYIYVSILYMSAIALSKTDKKICNSLIVVYISMFSIFSYNYLNNYGKQYDSVMQDNGLYEAYKYAKTLHKDIYVEDSRLGEEYVYYFLFDDSIDLKDYPKDYYPTVIYDSSNYIYIYII